MVSRAVMTEMVNFRLSDSIIGIQMYRNILGGYQRVSNSTIIGESSNKGGTHTYIADLKRSIGFANIIFFAPCSGLARPIKGVPVERSFPNPKRPNQVIQGIKFNSEGPSHLDGVDFRDFRHNQFRRATALLWKVIEIVMPQLYM